MIFDGLGVGLPPGTTDPAGPGGDGKDRVVGVALAPGEGPLKVLQGRRVLGIQKGRELLQGLKLVPGRSPGLQDGFQALQLLNAGVSPGGIVPEAGCSQVRFEALYPDFRGVQVKDTSAGWRGFAEGKPVDPSSIQARGHERQPLPKSEGESVGRLPCYNPVNDRRIP